MEGIRRLAGSRLRFPRVEPVQRRGANPDGDSSGYIDNYIWVREILRVKQFVDFYLKDVKVSRANVSSENAKIASTQGSKP